jgi:thymidylate synthase
MTIYDPRQDNAPGKDIPCNNWIHFQSRLGQLHMHVVIRSNDLMWGWSGINAFEWSALQEIVAGLVGVEVGELHFSISSLHLYDRHWKKANQIIRENELRTYPPGAGLTLPPRFNSSPTFRVTTLDQFDDLVSKWFMIEEHIRAGHYRVWALVSMIDAFPEPMLRSWLRVIAWWWTKDDSFFGDVRGTDLWLAAQESPRTKHDDSAKEDAVKAGTLSAPTQAELALKVAAAYDIPPEMLGLNEDGTKMDPFTEFVVNLHAEKHAVYGDSWKRRGEQIGILANIARKIDRLGVAGAGDTSADTAIDLLVYLVKYRLWLTDYAGAPTPSPLRGVSAALFSDQVEPVDRILRSLTLVASTPGQVSGFIAEITNDFNTDLEGVVSAGASGDGFFSKEEIVDGMIPKVARLARRLWLDEQSLNREGAAIDGWAEAQRAISEVANDWTDEYRGADAD